MTTQLPGNLAEIFPLRLRLRKEFRFFRSDDHVVAERSEDGQRFSLRPWQYEMIRRFDGEKTFEQSAREVYSIYKGGFTAVGLLNFYRWLYQEDLIWCRCESIFELVSEDKQQVEEVPANKSSHHDPKISRPDFGEIREMVGGMRPKKNWQRQAIGVTAIVLFSLSVIRLAYVAAPVFEPPVNRLYAEVEQFFYEGVRPTVQKESIAKVADSPAREVSISGRIERVPEPPRSPEPSTLETEERSSVDLPYIEELRRRLSECRIRRDEFYIQNNEDGYRREVEKMTALAREIGEIEAKL